MEELVNVEGLRKEVTSKPVPCGDAVTTTYFAADGTIVRQDTNIQVSEAFMATVESEMRAAMNGQAS